MWLDALWATIRGSGNALLHAAIDCEVELCRSGRGKYWLRNWLKVMQCGLEDTDAGRLGSKVGEACIRELEWGLPPQGVDSLHDTGTISLSLLLLL